MPSTEVFAIDEAMERLTQENPPVAKLVELRYFAGFIIDEAAVALNISDRTARRHWTYAMAWLREEISNTDLT